MGTRPPADTSSPSTSRRLIYFVVFSLIVAGIVGFTVLLISNDIRAQLNPSRIDPTPVAAGVTIKPFITLPGDAVFPIGLAPAPDSGFYLSLLSSGVIDKVDAQGNTTQWLSKEQVRASGPLFVGPDGILYAVGFVSGEKNAQGVIRKITSDGRVSDFVQIPNASGVPLVFVQIAFDSKGNLYFTDATTAQVWKIKPDGSGTAWWIAPSLGTTAAQPIAIVYDKAKNAMLISDIGTGAIYRVDVAADPPSGNLLVRQAGLDIRSITLDAKGRPLLAVWGGGAGKLSRLEDDGSITILAEGFRAPTSLIYRDDKVYVVNSDAVALFEAIKARPPFTIDVVDLGGTDSQ